MAVDLIDSILIKKASGRIMLTQVVDLKSASAAIVGAIVDQIIIWESRL